ncbi:MAG: hypothetical protein QXN68_06435 [Thermoplasmata archaeon]
MAIYVDQGQANNDEHLLSLLKSFLNYCGWEDVSVSSSNFTVTKLINNFRWYWHFDVGFTNRYTSNVFGLDYGYGTDPNVIYKRRMLIEYGHFSTNLQTVRNAVLNYYFILNNSPPGDTLILVIYQNYVFLTGYLGFLNLLIPNDTMQTIHHVVEPCYIDYLYVGLGNLIFQRITNSVRFPDEWLFPLFYYNSNYPQLFSESGGNQMLFPYYYTFNRNGFYSPLIPEIPLLQPIPFYVKYNNQWSYIGNLKGIYTCISPKTKPSTELYGSKTYLFVPLVHSFNSYFFYPWTLTPNHTYVIVISE